MLKILFLLILLLLSLGLLYPAIEAITSKKGSMDRPEIKLRFVAGTLLLVLFFANAYIFWFTDGTDTVLLRNLITKP